MKRLSLILSAALCAVAIAAVSPTAASAFGVPPKVTVGLPANGSWAKAVPSFTFSVTGTAVQKTCILSGPDTYIDQDPCSSPFRPVDTLPDGTYTYTVMAENTDGTDSGSTSFKLDRTAPTISIQSGVTEGSYGNASVAGFHGIYSDANIDTVTCRLDSGAETACGSAGAFTITYNSFGEGAHKFIAVATDKAGNVGYVERNFTIDRTAPTASIVLVGGAGETKDNTPAFLLSGSDTSGPVTKRCRIENQIDWLDCNADTWIASDGVADGLVTAWVEVRDRAGNNAYASYAFTVDSTMPVITVNGFANNVTTEHFPTISFSHSDLNKGDAKCGFDPADWEYLATCAEGAHSSDVRLGVGTHQFWVSATDTLGNVASAVYAFEIVEQLPPPTGGQDGGQGGGPGPIVATVAVKTKSGKVKRGKFTLKITVTTTNAKACERTSIVIAPKVKKAKQVRIKSVSKLKNGVCVATASVKLPAKFKQKKANVTASHGTATSKQTVKL